MAFDIYQLNETDWGSSQAENALYDYQDALITLFYEAPEGREHRKTHPEMGFWSAQLIYFGYVYVGVTLPQMAVEDVEEIITDIFPRKIFLHSPDEARDALPELIAFWEYLKREYKLPQSAAILAYLKAIQPDEFVAMIFDPSRFGMAKSFFMAGQAAGFDMTDEDQVNAFMHLHNLAQFAASEGQSKQPPAETGRKKREAAKEKRKRKAAKAARKRRRRRGKRK